MGFLLVFLLFQLVAVSISTPVSVDLCEFSISPKSCSTGTKKANGYFVLNAHESPWPTKGFCRVLSSQFTDSGRYTLSVKLYNAASRSGSGLGHPGIMYNAEDENNYDFVYFRPHSVTSCYQTGYVKAGKITMRATGKCPAGPPKGGTWFDVYVRVEGNVAFIYLNNQVVLKTTTILPYQGRGGVIVANGYSNTVYFKGLKLQSPSYSSLPGFTVTNCASGRTDDGGNHVLDARGRAWPKDGFCQAVSDWSGGISDYDVKAQLYNEIGWKGVNSGHLGVMYNVHGGVASYDFVYFRPHSTTSCYQTGYVLNGVPTFTGGKTGRCPSGPPKGKTWFEAKVSVRGNKATVYLDNKTVVSVTPHFLQKRVGGVIVANGYNNVIQFKHFTLVSH